jgi:hypothetical protein
MQVILEREDEVGVRLWCKHCNRIWLYHGHSNYYACCSLCHTAVHVRNNRVENNIAVLKAKKLLQSDPRGGTHNQTITTEPKDESIG